MPLATLGFPLDLGLDDDWAYVTIAALENATVSMLNGCNWNPPTTSGSALAQQRALNFITNRYFSYNYYRGHETDRPPAEICWSGRSDTAAAALALARGQSEPPDSAHTILISCACDFLPGQGLRAKLVPISQGDPGTLRRKWRAVEANRNIAALVLAKSDATLLKGRLEDDGENIESIPLAVGTLAALRARSGAAIVAVESDQLALLAAELGISREFFEPLSATGTENGATIPSTWLRLKRNRMARCTLAGVLGGLSGLALVEHDNYRRRAAETAVCAQYAERLSYQDPKVFGPLIADLERHIVSRSGWQGCIQRLTQPGSRDMHLGDRITGLTMIWKGRDIAQIPNAIESLLETAAEATPSNLVERACNFYGWYPKDQALLGAPFDQLRLLDMWAQQIPQLSELGGSWKPPWFDINKNTQSLAASVRVWQWLRDCSVYGGSNVGNGRPGYQFAMAMLKIAGALFGGKMAGVLKDERSLGVRSYYYCKASFEASVDESVVSCSRDFFGRATCVPNAHGRDGLCILDLVHEASVPAEDAEGP